MANIQCNNITIIVIKAENTKNSLKATAPDAEAMGAPASHYVQDGIYDGQNKKPSPLSELGGDQTRARLESQQKHKARNPPRIILTQNSGGCAAGALGQDRWRNNSGPGPESEDHVPRCSYELKFYPPSQRHPGILNDG